MSEVTLVRTFLQRAAHAAIGLGSIAALVGCPGGGDGDGSCPTVRGAWMIGGECGDIGLCNIEQEDGSCSVTLACGNDMSFDGTVSSGSISFTGSIDGVSGRCSGTLSGLDDADGDGRIAPVTSGTCTSSEDQAMCGFEAACLNGDCTEAPDEEDSGSGGAGGTAGTSVVGGQSGIGGSGANGGQGGSTAGVGGSTAGVGGTTGGQGGFAGIAGIGGQGGGIGGVGGEAGTGVTPSEGCSDTCASSNDAVCDDGGPGSQYSICGRGTDCTDCGAREPVVMSSTCMDTCAYAGDGACDDGGPGAQFNACEFATDCTDCGERNAADAPVEPVPGTEGCAENCGEFSMDGECDDGGPNSTTDICPFGSDCADCGAR